MYAIRSYCAPFHDARSLPGILIAAARELGGPLSAALPWKRFRDCIEQAYGGAGGGMEKALREGGLFAGPPAPSRGAASTASPRLPKTERPAFEGDPAKHPLLLTVYPSIAFYDGRITSYNVCYTKLLRNL